MGDSCHPNLLSRVTPSFLGDEGDKLLLHQVQETLKAGQMPKYKYFHARLLECYRFLERENTALLRAVQKNQPISESPKQIEELLDEFAFKVARKKDAHEKQAIRQASIEGRQAFMAKRWKSRYYSLERLDWIVDEVKRLLTPSSIYFQVSAHSGRAVEDLSCDEGYSSDIKYSDYAANDFVVPVSSIFLVDLLANHLVCEQRLKQQADSKPHLMHMLRREKKRRNYQKNQCSRLEDEVFLMENPPAKVQQPDAATVAQCFIFDAVCGPESGNYEVFKNLELLVTMVLHGQPVSLLVCGPDERENARTLYGRTDDGGAEPGLAQLCVSQIFDASRRRNRWTFTYHAFALICGGSEVYNLLADHPKRTSIDITPDASKFIQAGTVCLRIASPSDFQSMLVWINDRGRSVRRPPGYLFLLLRIHAQHTGDPDRFVTSWLYLADLSSCQQPEKTQPLSDPEGIDRACGRAVGRLNSLFVALRWRKRPNFGECPLAQLMQPMLTGLCRCLIVLSVSANPVHFQKTLAYLQFGTNAVQATVEANGSGRWKPVSPLNNW
ncbi:unnamed protein product [Dibothriocephalus latus]|uniref:Kinesin motor domain-containing protein n=1 Tax=Dibothriocephalus latus TaxID=60516 RepID=A0A3P7LZU2_DIBLA|nr:unnamed protein product [Dibothriocephalus latus]